LDIFSSHADNLPGTAPVTSEKVAQETAVHILRLKRDLSGNKRLFMAASG
jgi:hypothetical protein